MNAFDLEQLLTVATKEKDAVENPPGLQKIDGVIIGELIGLADEGNLPLVFYPSQPGNSALIAQSTQPITADHIGRRVVLMFEAGNPRRPIVMGYLQDNGAATEPDTRVQLVADGEQLQVSAKDKVVIRCGKASITLTKAGKVLINGTYISSRSSGVNRIRGGAVQLN